MSSSTPLGRTVGRPMNALSKGSPFRAPLLILGYSMLLAVALMMVLPFLWTLGTSLKPSADILAYPPKLVPWPISLEHFRDVTRSDFPRWVLNSLIVAVGTVALVLCVAVPAAYGATRFRFRGQTVALFLILLGMAIGQVATVVPLYFFGIATHLIDTYALLILVYAVWTVPMATWLLRGYFQSIPTELEEAAMLDGCTRLESLVRVILPITRPGLAAAAIITFVYSWNEFILALVLTSSDTMRTIPVGIYRYVATYGVDWGNISAATVIALAPILLTFLLLQRQFVEGLTAGTLGSQ